MTQSDVSVHNNQLLKLQQHNLDSSRTHDEQDKFYGRGSELADKHYNTDSIQFTEVKEREKTEDAGKRTLGVGGANKASSVR